MLRVVGILYIVFSSIGVLSGIVSAFTLSIMDDWLWLYGGIAMRETWYFYYIFPVLASVFTLVIGILAVNNCWNKEKASMLQVLGIVDITIVVLFQIIITALGVYTYLGFLAGFALFALPFSFVLPILLIVGARKNMR